MSELIDALPIPNYVPLLAKTAALIGVVIIFLCVGIATAIVFQLIKGYTNLELLGLPRRARNPGDALHSHVYRGNFSAGRQQQQVCRLSACSSCS